MNKKVTEKQLIEMLDEYRKKLVDDPKVSVTKFQHMLTAIYGCKVIIRNAFGSPQQREVARVK